MLAAFDTPSDSRRRQLTRLLSGYGVRVQRSVFRLQGTEVEVQRLWSALERVTVPDEDLLLMVRVGAGSWRQAGLLNSLEVPLTRVF